MKGTVILKYIIDIAMVITAIILIIKGIGGESLQPLFLILVGILMLAELITDLFHMH